MPLSSTVLTQQIIDKQILQHLEEKPAWSILPQDVDNDSMDGNLSLIEPAIPCATILHLSSYECNNNNKLHLDVNYFNFTADYKEFASNCKIYLTFNISIQYNIQHNPSFNIVVEPFDNKFDSYSNFYSKINSINLVSLSHNKCIYKYKVEVLLAVSKYLTQIRKHLKVLVCVAEIERVVILPIRYFSVLKHIFIGSVYELYDIIITDVLHTLIMIYCGKLNWCLGPPFIYDTLDICCKEKVCIADIECINKGINPQIKNIYCVISTSSSMSEIICTNLKGVNLLIYNSDIDKIEIIKESIETYTDFLCLKYRQYKESDDEKYNCENNVILAKCMSLDLNPKILKNKFGKLDFMLWIEWKESILSSLKNWKNRLCDDSLMSFISWYEMKRIRKESKMKIIHRNRIKSVKQQRKNRQNSNKKKLLYKNQQRKHSHKRHLYNRW